MSELFAYICTGTTADPFVPKRSLNMDQLSRDVSDGFAALSGGYRQVGRISFFPLQKSQSGHLLCDGREVPKNEFPELYDYLRDFMGASTDPNKFVLPNYIGDALTGAATAAAETTSGGTVTSESSSPGGGDSGGSIDPAVDSGGRVRRNALLEP